MVHLVRVGEQYRDDAGRLFSVATHSTPDGDVGYVVVDEVAIAVIIPSAWNARNDATWPPA